MTCGLRYILQRAAGRQHLAGGQLGLQCGSKISEDSAGKTLFTPYRWVFRYSVSRSVFTSILFVQVVVQEPGQSFKPLLPSILSLCLDQVYPIVSEVQNRNLT